MKKTIQIEQDGKKHKITLRHLKKSDVDGIWTNFNQVVDERIYLPVLIPVRSQYEKNAWYENVKKDNEICIVADYSKLKSPHNIIGQCEISNIEWEAATHVGNLGIIVSKDFRNLGVGKHLIIVAIQESKELQNKEKICLSTFTSNKRAIHLYETLGFKTVGTREKQFYMNSTYYDEIMMEVWIDDFLARHANE